MLGETPLEILICKQRKSLNAAAKKNRMQNQSPDNYRPETPADLIGEARKIGEAILKQIQRVKDEAPTFKFMLHGQPGAGKTSIAKMIAREIAADKIDIETVNGRNIDSATVREWQRNAAYGSLFGGWKVKLINEADLIPAAAQDLMLTYLDDLPPQNAVVATSNQNVAALTERFQTRFRLVRVLGPSCDELARWLIEKWRLPKQTADFISLGACGNVRQALLDTANVLTFDKTERRPKASVRDTAKSEASKRAWNTIRSRYGNGNVAA
jgi:replication-associated recombination protein RarA